MHFLFWSSCSQLLQWHRSLSGQGGLYFRCATPAFCCWLALFVFYLFQALALYYLILWKFKARGFEQTGRLQDFEAGLCCVTAL